MLRKRGETYFYDFHINGQRIRGSTGTGVKKAAQQYHDKLKARYWDEANLNRYPFKAAATEYFKTRVGSSSFKDDLRRLKALDEWCGDKMLDQIDITLVGDIKAGLMKRELQIPTVNRYLSVLTAILNYAANRGWLDSLPKVKKDPEPNKKLEFLTPEEAIAFISELKQHHQKEFVAFAINTGLRMRNITHLTWDEVDLFRKTITIEPGKMKNRKTLVIPINPQALDLLKTRYRENSEGRVFRLANGKSYDRVGQRAFRKAGIRAGIKKEVYPHLFRHTFASWHVLNGTSLYELKELGGWSKIESVLIYAHLNVDHLKGIEDRASIRRAFELISL